jgi:cobalt-precorrin-5B (C1)-methyltransferase
MEFAHYIFKDKKRLRCGFTTGTCAALAAKAAAALLFDADTPQTVRIATPKGICVEVRVCEAVRGEGFAQCAVQKDAGDDPDVTNGLRIRARVETAPGAGIAIDGGEGVGRVTKRGLDQPVGAAAINRIPRSMIEQAVQEVCGRFAYTGGMRVIISIPGGEAVAKRTFNPRLGVVGGLSVLGTSGIVEPMSEQAMVDTIRLELGRLVADGTRQVVLTPGNYGDAFLRRWLSPLSSISIRYANFVGQTLDAAAELGFERVLLVGHIGKMIKLAGGIMNTHSSHADARLELLTAHAALCGAGPADAAALMDCVTTEEAVEILVAAGLLDRTMRSVMEKIAFHVGRRTGEGIWAEAVVFSNRRGILGKTQGADRLARLLLEDV